MTHFAQISPTENPNLFMVTNVIVAEQDVINSGLFGDPKTWVQTSYNTRGNVHYGQDGKPDGGIALRANYAAINGTYKLDDNIFYNPRPIDIKGILCNSWTVSAPDWIWKPPIPMPTDGYYIWDETTQNWISR
jgi:hypothetical protein